MWWLRPWRRRQVLHPPRQRMVFADLILPPPDAGNPPVVRPPVPVREVGGRW